MIDRHAPAATSKQGKIHDRVEAACIEMVGARRTHDDAQELEVELKES